MLITRVRNNGRVDIVIVLADENIERMKRYDPAEIVWADLPSEYSSRRPGAVAVAFATAEDQAEIERMSRTDPENWKERALKLISRGFEFRPDLGDHDFGPTVLGKPTEGPKQ